MKIDFKKVATSVVCKPDLTLSSSNGTKLELNGDAALFGLFLAFLAELSKK